jgi:hypothetical protein
MLGYSHIKPFFHPKHLIKSEFNAKGREGIDTTLSQCLISQYGETFLCFTSRILSRDPLAVRQIRGVSRQNR